MCPQLQVHRVSGTTRDLWNEVLFTGRPWDGLQALLRPAFPIWREDDGSGDLHLECAQEGAQDCHINIQDVEVCNPIRLRLDGCPLVGGRGSRCGIVVPVGGECDTKTGEHVRDERPGWCFDV